MEVSVNYFNYEKTTKIDVKYNSNENYPLFISIVNLLDTDHLKRPNLKQYNSKSCLYNNKLHSNYSDYTTYKQITECPQKYGIKSIDFLINNITKDFLENNIFNYSLELNTKIINLETIHTTHAYYYELPLTDIIHYNSINMSEYSVNIRQDNESFELFKLFVKPPSGRYYKTHLVLSMYNTLNDYQSRISITSGQNCDQTIKVTRTIRQNLKPPYGDCSDYSKNRRFNGTNQWHCYRQCLKTMAENRFHCKPVVIEKTTHELDFVFRITYIECNSSVHRLIDDYTSHKIVLI